MMPRVEVGLIFATMATPPLLLWSLKRDGPAAPA
jgi:hypothetical protein